MKVPGKIYVFQHGINAFDPLWHFTKSKEKHTESHEYIHKKSILDFLGKVSIEVNSFTRSSANDFRAEGANKVISLIKDYIESL